MKNNKLHNTKSTGFKSPDHYFDSLEHTIFSKLAEAKLSTKVNSTGFNVPDAYFETFDNKIINTIEKTSSVKVVSLFSWKKVAYISGIAASIILAFNLLITSSDDFTIGDLETASIENYLLNEDLNAYEIAPYLSGSDLDLNDFIDTKMNASDIEDYLLQNSDVEQLMTD